MDEVRRKPFWKKRRWIVVAVLWLLTFYPLSMGPFMYAFYMDWVPDAALPVVDVVYRPVFELSRRSPRFDAALNDYCDWWYEISVRHRRDGYASPPPDVTPDDPPPLP